MKASQYRGIYPVSPFGVKVLEERHSSVLMRCFHDVLNEDVRGVSTAQMKLVDASTVIE